MSRFSFRPIRFPAPKMYACALGALCLLSPVPRAQESHQARVSDETRLRKTETDRINVLRTACQQGEIGTAVDIINDLFELNVSPLRIYGVIRSMFTRMDVNQFSHDLEQSIGNTAAANNLILILAYSMRDSIRFERMQSGIQEKQWWDLDILERIGREAMSREDWPIARWAYVSMDEIGQLKDQAGILSLAQVFYHTGESDKTLIMLDRLGDMARLPRIYGDQARILRARIHFRRNDIEKALSVLTSVRSDRTREKAEADLLSALYAFVAFDDSTARSELVTAAGRAPYLPETNEALAFSSLLDKIVKDPERTTVLQAMRYELQERDKDAADLYLEAGYKRTDDTGPNLLIRAARCLERAREKDEALHVWYELTANEDVRDIALLGLGDCLSSNGFADSANATYTELLLSFPESPHAARARNRLLK